MPEWSDLVPASADASKAIPWKIYGDKGPYFKNLSLQVFSMSSLFVHSGNTLYSRFLICSLAASSDCKLCGLITQLGCMVVLIGCGVLGAIPGRFLLPSTATRVGTLDTILNYIADDLPVVSGSFVCQSMYWCTVVMW